MKTQHSHVKLSATVPGPLLDRIDALVNAKEYPSRSAVIEEALERILRERMDALIEAEAAKLDRAEEKALAEEGMDDYATLAGEEGRF